jgi:hypothetical protein
LSDPQVEEASSGLPVPALIRQCAAAVLLGEKSRGPHLRTSSARPSVVHRLFRGCGTSTRFSFLFSSVATAIASCEPSGIMSDVSPRRGPALKQWPSMQALASQQPTQSSCATLPPMASCVT